MEKNIWIGAFICFFSALLLHAYQSYEERKLYAECLKITEKLLEADKGRISTPYCSL